MMSFKTLLFTLTLLIAAVSGASSQHVACADGLDKPALAPAKTEWMNPEFEERYMNATKILDITAWNNYKINAHCKNIFTKEGYELEDIVMFTVTFRDVCHIH